MAIVVKERNIGRKLTASENERSYTIKGATDEATAAAALLAYVPATIDQFILNIPATEMEEFAENLYYATCHWVPPTGYRFQQPQSFHISFDISAQSVHITQSRSTVNRYAKPGTIARDFKGAINVDEDGTIEGIDVLVPFTTFQLNYTFTNEQITDAYIQTLTETVGSVNSTPFHEFAIGVLLLTKVSGQQREDGNWDLSFGCSVSKNATGLIVGDIIGIEKKGWELLWVYYRTEEVSYDDLKATHKVPQSANIEQVYPTADFGVLGLG